jgi:hypothetical protein
MDLAADLAGAIDSAFSETGEYNNYTSPYSFADLKRMARAVLKAKR